MLSAFFGTLGILLGILFIVVLIAIGFAGGAYKLLKAIIRGIRGLFEKPSK